MARRWSHRSMVIRTASSNSANISNCFATTLVWSNRK
jgi:hypothetical protein